MPPPPNTLLLLAALLLATASSTAAMQLFPMASHPEVDACVDAEADERRLLQHDHCDRGGVSTCGVDDPVMTRHPGRWPAVVDALRRSVRDTTARAREGLRRPRLVRGDAPRRRRRRRRRRRAPRRAARHARGDRRHPRGYRAPAVPRGAVAPRGVASARAPRGAPRPRAVVARPRSR